MNFKYLQEWGRAGAQGNQKVMVGPIGHGALSGDLEYPESRLGSDEELRFFDYWLRGIDNGIMDEPPVTYYMMASARTGQPSAKNGWRTADEWPPSASRRVRYYLTEGGGLSTRSPASSAASTTYAFDPSNPVPTLGGLNLRGQRGPMDQRDVGERTDYLRFQTPVLEEDLVVAGKIDLELWASSDAPDTDFIAKLVDVYPDGYEALVLDMGLRARFRNGRRTEDVQLLTPGEPNTDDDRSVEHRDHDRAGTPPGGAPDLEQLPPLRCQPQHRRGGRRDDDGTAYRQQHDLSRRESPDRAAAAGDGRGAAAIDAVAQSGAAAVDRRRPSAHISGARLQPCLWASSDMGNRNVQGHG